MTPVCERILDAAAELVRAGSPVTVSAVAEQAGVARGTVYRYHSDRSALMTALVMLDPRSATCASRSSTWPCAA